MLWNALDACIVIKVFLNWQVLEYQVLLGTVSENPFGSAWYISDFFASDLNWAAGRRFLRGDALKSDTFACPVSPE